MKVLLTGPNIYDENRLGGIITVARTILALFPGMEYFARSGVQGKSRVRALWEFAGILRAFRKRIRKGDIDLVHINSALERSAVVRDSLFVRMAKKAKIPIVLHLHGGKYLTYDADLPTSRMIRFMLRSADQIIVLGKQEKEQLKTRYGLTNVSVLQNALDLSRIPEPAPKLHRSPVRFIYLGRIDEFKGLNDILQAFKEIREKGLPFQYDLYGNGPLSESYPEKCRDVLGDHFSYQGVVLGEDKWKALNASDVFLLPSLYEGLPMSLLEAMAVGSLCVTTPVGSIPEVIVHGRNGLLVEKENPSRLQAMLEDIIREPGTWQGVAAAGQETVYARFNGDVYRKALEEIYENT